MEIKAMELAYGKGFKQPKTYELWLRRYWATLHRDLKAAREAAETRAMHALGEIPAVSFRGEIKRGRGSAIDLDIRGAEKEPYIFKGYEIAPRPDKLGQFYPAAKITLTDKKVPLKDESGNVVGWGYETILVDISEAVKNISKNARHKAIRLGKPLPEPNQLEVEKIIARAVREERK